MMRKTCSTCQYNVVGVPIGQLPFDHTCQKCFEYSGWAPVPVAGGAEHVLAGAPTEGAGEQTLGDHIALALDRLETSFTEEISRLEDRPRAALRQVGGDHYKAMGVEPWDVIDTWPYEQRVGAYRAGALKYLMRMGSKDDTEQEVKKCAHYLEKLLEVLRAGR